MSQATSLPPPRLRPRPWLRRALLAVTLLVLLGAGGILGFRWFSSHELNAVIAEMDRQDPGWRLDEIEASRKVVPDAQNSMLHIVAIGKLRGGQPVITPAMEKMFENLPPHVQLNEQQATFLEKRFEILRTAAVEARKLKDMPEGRHPIKYSDDFISTLIPHVQDAREVCELLQWDAARRVHASDVEGALESCLALQHAAKSMGDEPFLISQLVRYACNGVAVGAMERTLAQGYVTEASEPALRRMQAALTRELPEPTLLIGLRGERAGLHQFVQALTEGKVNAGTFKAVGPTLAVMQAIMGTKAKTGVGDEVAAHLIDRFPGYLTLQHAALLRFYSSLVEAGKLPPQEREERFQLLESKIQEEPYLVRALVPGFVKVREAERRIQANLRCALAALAAERFRLAQSRWPEALDELVKIGYLDAVPTDPYDGKPIRLKRTADGLIVYSVGQDKIDNGGAINHDRPMDPGADLGFWLWDIARRRQPPNPPVPENEGPLR